MTYDGTGGAANSRQSDPAKKSPAKQRRKTPRELEEERRRAEQAAKAQQSRSARQKGGRTDPTRGAASVFRGAEPGLEASLPPPRTIPSRAASVLTVADRENRWSNVPVKANPPCGSVQSNAIWGTGIRVYGAYTNAKPLSTAYCSALAPCSTVRTRLGLPKNTV